METLRLRINPRAPVLRVNLKPRTPALHLRIGEGHSVDWYPGPYEVTPKRQDQTLATKNKTMREDVTVYEIPYYQTANPYGTTFVIGE